MLEFSPEFIGTQPSLNFAQFDRLAVIHNPNSPAASDFAADASQRFGKSTRWKFDNFTSEPDVAGNAELLEQENPKHRRNLWIVAGGDGTVSNFLSAVYRRHAKDPVLVVPTGYANDIAHMLYHRQAYDDPLANLSVGRIAEVRPIQVSRWEQNMDEGSALAFGYFGIGFSGRSADRLNRMPARDSRYDQHPVTRKIRDSLEVWKDLRQSQELTIYDSRNLSSPKGVVELLFVNGSRMADTVSFRTQLLADEAGRIELRHRHLPGLLVGLGKAATGGYEKIRPGDKHFFTVETKAPADSDDYPAFMIQRDGEPAIRQSGTSFSVSLADETVNVITTKSHP